MSETPRNKLTPEQIEEIRKENTLAEDDTVIVMTTPYINTLCDMALAISAAEQRAEAMGMQLRDAYEIYAGMEGIPVPQTACEGYLLRIIDEMQKALATGKSAETRVMTTNGKEG